VVAGVPARIIKKRFPEELVQRLQNSKWWNLEVDVLKAYSYLMNEPEKFLDALEANR